MPAGNRGDEAVDDDDDIRFFLENETKPGFLNIRDEFGLNALVSRNRPRRPRTPNYTFGPPNDDLVTNYLLEYAKEQMDAEAAAYRRFNGYESFDAIKEFLITERPNSHIDDFNRRFDVKICMRGDAFGLEVSLVNGMWAFAPVVYRKEISVERNIYRLTGLYINVYTMVSAAMRGRRLLTKESFEEYVHNAREPLVEAYKLRSIPLDVLA